MIEEHHVRNLVAMRRALYRHNGRCPMPARSFLLNPADAERLGIPVLWGVPIVTDPKVPMKRVRVECDGSAEGVEDILEDWAVG